MKKANFGLVFGIPLVIAAAAVGLAITMRMSSKADEPSKYRMPSVYTQSGKPSGSYGVMVKTTAPGTSLEETTPDSLTQELGNAVDDGGTKDMEALKQSTSGL